jgi:hypothetical protein
VGAQTGEDGSKKQVKLFTKSIEVVSVKSTAAQCKDQKGVTVRLRVIGNGPIDIMGWMGLKNEWMPRHFDNQAVGSEIEDFSCYPKSPFKYYSREAGSKGVWPKP